MTGTMAKKKKAGGKHATPRKAVQFPADWLAVAQRRAGKRPAPVMWYLIELIKRDAEADGDTDLPPTPWTTGPVEAEPKPRR
jgi:hypothetical protein